MYIKKGGGYNDIFCFGKRNQVSESIGWCKNEAEAIQKAQNVYDSAKADSDDIRAIKTWTISRRNYEED